MREKKKIIQMNDGRGSFHLAEAGVPFMEPTAAHIQSGLRSPLVFFSTNFLETIIWCPHPRHFKRKSIPTRKISHSWLPHGWAFFNFTISPTW